MLKWVYYSTATSISSQCFNRDLVTGTLRHIYDGLTYDLTVVSAPMGTYPSFAFAPSSSAIIIWGAGQIWHIPLSTNSLGERVPGGTPAPLKWTAHIEKRLAETRVATTELEHLETAEKQRVTAFTELRADETGERIVFQAAGVNVVQRVVPGRGGRAPLPQRVPTQDPNAPYYNPSFVVGREDLVLHAKWSDTNFSSFEVADLKHQRAYEIVGIPQGRYHTPTLCEARGDTRMLAFVKTAGDGITGKVIATAQPGIYIAHLELPAKDGLWKGDRKIDVKDLKFVSLPSLRADSVNFLRYVDKNSKLLVQTAREVFIVDLGKGPNKFGDYETTTLARGEMSSELAIAPQGYGKNLRANYVAAVDFKQVYVTPAYKNVSAPVWSKPGNATKGLTRVSLDGGHDVTWSSDGKRVFWLLGMSCLSVCFYFQHDLIAVDLGPYLHSLEVSQLHKCSSAVHKDPLTFGIQCTKNILDYQEIIVHHSTDIARLKDEASLAAHAQGLDDSTGSAVMLITNATVLTMETGSQSGDLLHNALLVVRGGVIQLVLEMPDVLPQGALVLNAQGGALSGTVATHMF